MKKKGNPVNPRWETLARPILAVGFAAWMIATILEADKVSAFGLALRFGLAAIVLAGVVALQRRYPEKSRRSGRARS